MMKKKQYMDRKSVLILLIIAILIIPLVSKSQECERVKITDFPIEDLPTMAERPQLNGEVAYKYYYGIGVEKDYVKARYLAFIEAEKEGGDGPFDGYSILMMLYANGYGVKKDLNLSIRLACANIWSAPAELEGRTQHLKDIKTGDSTGTFDVCDDITSGRMDGMCHLIPYELAEVKRNQTLDSITEKWTPREKQAYMELRKAANDFFDLRMEFEVDLTGTSREAFSLEEREDLEDQFLRHITRADRCTMKHFSVKDFLKADNTMNVVYSKIKYEDITIEGSITKEQVRKTQRVWIQYRKAWAAFAAIKCPHTEISWKTMITNERIEELQNIGE
jgi:uncharacterized protein YecT (DUF1311 family)